MNPHTFEVDDLDRLIKSVSIYLNIFVSVAVEKRYTWVVQSGDFNRNLNFGGPHQCLV